MNKNKLEALKAILEKEVTQDQIKGGRIRVLQGGQKQFDYGYGYANAAQKTPVEEDTIMRLFSMSKPITAAAAMILYERGQLDLFAPISRYLEEFADQQVFTDKGMVSALRSIQVRDLLNMTSPIPYPDATPGNEVGNLVDHYYERIKAQMRKGKETTTRDFICGLSQFPLAFQPGDRWQYSAAADILGAVIEAASGKQFGVFLEEELFTPLGMKDTGFYVPEEKRDRFAQAYYYDGIKGTTDIYRDNHLCVGDWIHKPLFESGGAGLVSTLKDFQYFAQMLAGDGDFQGKRILGRKTMEYMRTPQLTEHQKRTADWDSMWGYSYGNLMRVLEDPSAGCTNGSVGEFGWDGWMGCYFFVSPRDQLIFLYFVQMADGCCLQEDRRLMRQIVYGALE